MAMVIGVACESLPGAPQPTPSGLRSTRDSIPSVCLQGSLVVPSFGVRLLKGGASPPPRPSPLRGRENYDSMRLS